MQKGLRKCSEVGKFSFGTLLKVIIFIYFRPCLGICFYIQIIINNATAPKINIKNSNKLLLVIYVAQTNYSSLLARVYRYKVCVVVACNLASKRAIVKYQI